jgi:hypothetical protein
MLPPMLRMASSFKDARFEKNCWWQGLDVIIAEAKPCQIRRKYNAVQRHDVVAAEVKSLERRRPDNTLQRLKFVLAEVKCHQRGGKHDP